MSRYIGCKMVAAEPCKEWEDVGTHKVDENGYKVTYPDVNNDTCNECSRRDKELSRKTHCEFWKV